MSDKTLAPNNEELEALVLGCYLVDMDAPIYAKKQVPNLDDFYYGFHKEIWEHIFHCLMNDKIPTLEVITLRMMDDDSLKVLPDGSMYLHYLVDVAQGNQYDLEKHIKLLKEFNARRKVITEATRVAAEAWNLNTSLEKVMSEHVSEIAATADAYTQTTSPQTTASERLEARYKGKGPEPISTGLSDLNRLLDGGFVGPHLIYIAARPGMGKTSFALNNLAYEAALVGHKTLFISYEMSEDQLMARLGAMHTGISSRKIMRTHTLDDGEFKAVKAVYDHVAELPLTIDDRVFRDPEDVAMRCLIEQARNGLDLVIIDYVQLMHGKGYNATEKMTYVSGELKALSRTLNCPVVGLSQLSRAVEGRGDKRPILSDLRESGSMEQDASYVGFIYRDDVYDPDTQFPNTAEFILAKSRDGTTGTANLFFNKEGTVFADLEAETSRQIRNQAKQGEIIFQPDDGIDDDTF